MPVVLGEKISLGFGEISDTVKRHVHNEHVELITAQLNSIDAFNWEQADQGRDVFLEGGMLSREDIAGNKELPSFIRTFREEKERGINRVYIYDRFWELYYDHVLSVAERHACRFLTDYLSYEIELRLALSAIRVRERGGQVEDHSILSSFSPGDYANLAVNIKSKKNPLEVERFLDEERLRQIYRFEGINGFSIDALLAYLSRAAIYYRWEKISEKFDMDTYLWQGGSK
jgi:hypothetical protein